MYCRVSDSFTVKKFEHIFSFAHYVEVYALRPGSLLHVVGDAGAVCRVAVAHELRTIGSVWIARLRVSCGRVSRVTHYRFGVDCPFTLSPPSGPASAIFFWGALT